jgi:hypothetical protein
MFCKNCGQPVDEGKAFCAQCGTPVGTGGTPVRAGGMPVGAAPAAPAPQAPAAPGPVRPMAPPEYVPGWVPPQPPPRRGGLIAGIIAAVVIILAGAGVGVYFGFIRDGGNGDVVVSTGSTKPHQSTSSTLGPSTSGGVTTSIPSVTTGTSNTSGSTVQTIPSLGTTVTSAATTTTGNQLDAYLLVTDELVAELVADDARIPELATKINATAPKVPQSVRDELQKMAGSLTAMLAKLEAFAVPPGFEESASWLDKAGAFMVDRIQSTIAGVEAMWATGTIESASGDFDQGRKDRDAYRKAMAEYYDTVPID